MSQAGAGSGADGSTTGPAGGTGTTGTTGTPGTRGKPGPPSTTGTLGTKNLTTMHAVAQALAIGPMFSVALILGGVSRPDIGAGWNATLAVLLAGLGVVAIAYTISLYARK